MALSVMTTVWGEASVSRSSPAHAHQDPERPAVERMVRGGCFEGSQKDGVSRNVCEKRLCVDCGPLWDVTRGAEKGMGGIVGVTGVDATWASAWLSRPRVRSSPGRLCEQQMCPRAPRKAQKGMASPGWPVGSVPSTMSGRQRKKGRVSWPEGLEFS